MGKWGEKELHKGTMFKTAKFETLVFKKMYDGKEIKRITVIIL